MSVFFLAPLLNFCFLVIFSTVDSRSWASCRSIRRVSTGNGTGTLWWRTWRIPPSARRPKSLVRSGWSPIKVHFSKQNVILKKRTNKKKGNDTKVKQPKKYWGPCRNYCHQIFVSITSYCHHCYWTVKERNYPRFRQFSERFFGRGISSLQKPPT